MGRSRLPAALLPPGLIVEHVHIDDIGVAATARSRERGAICPDCGEPSKRVHSRYARSLSDLPAHGRPVRVSLTVRRFRCGNDRCPGRIFAERFGDDIVAPCTPHGAAADGSPPSRPRAWRPPRPGPRPAPADAGEQGHPAADGPGAGAGGEAGLARDRHRRPGVEARAPLRHHRLRPGAARDRGRSPRSRGGHGRGVADGSSRRRDRLARPRRWPWSGGRPRSPRGHSDRRSLAPDGEREPVLPRRGAAIHVADPPRARRGDRRPGAADLCGADAVRGLLAPRGDERGVRALVHQRVPIRQIALRAGSSRQTVRRILRGERDDVFRVRVRANSLEPWLVQFDDAWSGGCRNGAELRRRLRRDSFGAAFDATASVAACASSPNGPPGGAVPRWRGRPVPGSARPAGRSR